LGPLPLKGARGSTLVFRCNRTNENNSRKTPLFSSATVGAGRPSEIMKQPARSGATMSVRLRATAGPVHSEVCQMPGGTGRLKYGRLGARYNVRILPVLPREVDSKVPVRKLPT